MKNSRGSSADLPHPQQRREMPRDSRLLHRAIDKSRARDDIKSKTLGKVDYSLGQTKGIRVHRNH